MVGVGEKVEYMYVYVENLRENYIERQREIKKKRESMCTVLRSSTKISPGDNWDYSNETKKTLLFFIISKINTH